jgi:membrane-associated phospholipid phosphatase
VSLSPYPLETPKHYETTLTLRKRIALTALVCCIQMIYIPTSNRITGGIEPKLSIDIFPVWPIWVLPYVLCYLLWTTSLAWIVFKAEDRFFRSFIAACLVTFLLGNLTFIFFPTYVRSVTFAGNDLFANLLRTIHETWGRYDAFPSGHVYITTIVALFFSRWYPRYKLLWILILVIVSLSTLFTAQHYILDVLGGYLVALAGYHFGLWWHGFASLRKRMSKEPRTRIPSSSLN